MAVQPEEPHSTQDIAASLRDTGMRQLEILQRYIEMTLEGDNPVDLPRATRVMALMSMAAHNVATAAEELERNLPVEVIELLPVLDDAVERPEVAPPSEEVSPPTAQESVVEDVRPRMERPADGGLLFGEGASFKLSKGEDSFEFKVRLSPWAGSEYAAISESPYVLQGPDIYSRYLTSREVQTLLILLANRGKAITARAALETDFAKDARNTDSRKAAFLRNVSAVNSKLVEIFNKGHFEYSRRLVTFDRSVRPQTMNFIADIIQTELPFSDSIAPVISSEQYKISQSDRLGSSKKGIVEKLYSGESNIFWVSIDGEEFRFQFEKGDLMLANTFVNMRPQIKELLFILLSTAGEELKREDIMKYGFHQQGKFEIAQARSFTNYMLELTSSLSRHPAPQLGKLISVTRSGAGSIYSIPHPVHQRMDERTIKVISEGLQAEITLNENEPDDDSEIIAENAPEISAAIEEPKVEISQLPEEVVQTAVLADRVESSVPTESVAVPMPVKIAAIKAIERAGLGGINVNNLARMLKSEFPAITVPIINRAIAELNQLAQKNQQKDMITVSGRDQGEYARTFMRNPDFKISQPKPPQERPEPRGQLHANAFELDGEVTILTRPVQRALEVMQREGRSLTLADLTYHVLPAGADRVSVQVFQSEITPMLEELAATGHIEKRTNKHDKHKIHYILRTKPQPAI